MDGNGGKFEDWREIISSPKGLVSEEFVKVEEGGDEKRGGSIAERRAAKCGFNASRINVARFRSGTSPLSSPGKVCPYLTIPAGISPTALLDSPIMLHNSQGQPSPTTGTYPFPSLNHESLMLNSVTAAADGDSDSDVGSSLSFKTNRGPVLLPCISELANKPPMDFEFPAEYQIETVTNNCTTDTCAAEVKLSKDTFLNANCTSLKRSRPTNTAGYQMSHLLEEQQKEVCAPVEMLRTSEDGYNWRKYGQKQVKGSEFPRSYYKCTHPNCQVKKKVERSHDGQITEIIYKGAHNHPKPQPSRRTILGSQFSFTEISGIENGSGIKAEGGALWRNTQMGCNDMKGGLDWRVDGLERTSSTSVVTEISDRLSNTQGKSMGLFESAGTQELSSTLVSRDGDDEDRATQGSISLGDDADDGESESKRRRKDNCIIETNMTSRASREPRVVVQIESEIDVLDDGYRWRKYGQKVVKGNPNPRSYYKCTSAGCPVRKHVERASHNLKSVITTYEGKHNHEVPAAKNSSQVNSVVGSLPPAVSSTQPPLTLPRTANAAKPEPQVHDLPLCFERKPVPSNDFMRPYSLGSLGTEMKFGASSVYPMKLPPLPNSLSFGFGSSIMNPNHNNPHTACSVSPVLHDFPFSLPVNIRGSGNMDLGGVDFSNIRKPMGSVQSFIDGQQFRENDVKFIKPKQEQDDNLYDSLPIADHANASSSSMFCHLIGNYPS